jgi:peptidoglycan/LPS O-acetylase OafA/YrhL
LGRRRLRSQAVQAPARFYRSELDALRFFAFFIVFWHHAALRSRWLLTAQVAGAFGVAIFFALSSYLIVTLLLRERDNTGTIQLRAFALSRILRI